VARGAFAEPAVRIITYQVRLYGTVCTIRMALYDMHTVPYSVCTAVRCCAWRLAVLQIAVLQIAVLCTVQYVRYAWLCTICICMAAVRCCAWRLAGAWAAPPRCRVAATSWLSYYNRTTPVKSDPRSCTLSPQRTLNSAYAQRQSKWRRSRYGGSCTVAGCW
jgi:hypothetical protein